MMRGLHEAADINTFLNSPDPRLVGRTGRYDSTTTQTYLQVVQWYRWYI